MKILRKLGIILLSLILIGSIIGIIYLNAGIKDLPSNLDNTAFKGDSLYKTIEKYADFGIHRMSTRGDSMTINWVAQTMQTNSFQVEFQEFSTRQFFFEEGTLQIGTSNYEFAPQWWIPAFTDSLLINGTLVNYEKNTINYDNKIVFLVYKQGRFGAYFEADYLAKIQDIAAKGALAIISAIEQPSGEIYLYNVTATEPQLLIPVLVIGYKHYDSIIEQANQKTEVQINLKGHYKPYASSKNIIAQKGNSDKPAIIISTPLSGWFTNAAERGPGLAIFLAFANWINANNIDGNFIFVATGGHELSHVGADKFIKELAPKPSKTKCWIHLGASLTAYHWKSIDGQLIKTSATNLNQKVCSFSNNNVKLYWNYWRPLGWIPYPSFIGAVGETKDVKKYGYQNYIGFGGKHTYFHTPKDDLNCVSPEILEEVGENMLNMFWQIIED